MTAHTDNRPPIEWRWLASMETFLEYRTRKETKNVRRQVLSEKYKELSRRGQARKGWKKAYEASGDFDKDVEAAKRKIPYLQRDAASNPKIIKEYETEKARAQLIETLKTGKINEPEINTDIDGLIDRMIDHFTNLIKENACGFYACAGGIPQDQSYWDRFTYEKIERKVDKEDAEEYFEYLTEERLDIELIQDVLVDEDGPIFESAYKRFLELNPDVEALLAQVPSCGAVIPYIHAYLQKHSQLFEFVAEQIHEAFDMMDENEYLELNLANDEDAQDLYERFIEDTET